MKTFEIKQFTNSPLQITKKKIIYAPIERVWEIVADHKGHDPMDAYDKACGSGKSG